MKFQQIQKNYDFFDPDNPNIMENPEQVNFSTGLACNKMHELEEEKG